MMMNDWNDIVQKGQVGYMRDSQDLISEGEAEALRTLYRKELKTCSDEKEKKELTAMHLDAIAIAVGNETASRVFKERFDG